MSSSIMDAVEGYLERGWAVVPLEGKVPVLKEWTRSPVTSMAEAEPHWRGSCAPNVGICTGSPQGRKSSSQ